MRHFWQHEQYGRAISDALQLLGIERLVLAIHDSSFPSDGDEELGRGTPHGRAAAELLTFVRALGFTGLQLGPQGQTTRDNPSPYDGTLFSRNHLSVAPLALCDAGLVTDAEVAAEVSACPREGGGLMRYRHAFDATERLLRAAATRFVPSLEFELFCREQAVWLDGDALYFALSSAHGHDDWQRWPEPDRALYRDGGNAARIGELERSYAAELHYYRFVQFIAHGQHQALQTRIGQLGLTLSGDLQVGCSYRDRWRWSTLFLRGYAMGAPPSRTTPDGQAWGFPLLDPAQFDGAVADFVRMRLAKLLTEFDAVRIDHPHGFVCPWAYDVTAADALAAVRAGARLFDSPDLPDHPDLARWAIARPSQIDHSRARWDDLWVRTLDESQVERYGALFDVMMECVRRAGRRVADVQCEVLSTWPYPLWAVMRRHDLGRMRVTQKASLTNPHDVYRSDNAEPHDWMMVGNHDTAPLWALLGRWSAAEKAARASYLAERLVLEPVARAEFSAATAVDDGALAEAQFADLFASRAANVSVFFADLLGMSERYNLAGFVDEHNWMLRVPTEYRALYADRAAVGQALHLPRVLRRALAAKGRTPSALMKILDELCN